MENKFLLTDDLLWDYADGFLEPAEKLIVEKYLQEHPEDQAKLEAIKAEKRAFAAIPAEKPSSGFSQQLMAAWTAEQGLANPIQSSTSSGRDWILWAIALSFGLMIALPFFLFPADAAPAGFNIPEQYVPQIELPGIDWYGIVNSAVLQNSLLLVMAFLGLKLLDKFLLVRTLRVSGQ